MIVRILIGFAAATFIILLLVWLATGGAREVAQIARGITNPFSFIFTGQLSSFRLPWQPENAVRGPIVNSDGASAEAEAGEQQTPEEELSTAQKDYDAIMRDLSDAQAFGEPSPHRGKVTIAQGAATERTASAEYLELEAAWDNTAPVQVTGWSLQSALTGVRAHIPRGAQTFALGSVNTQGDIFLDPGSFSIVSTGVSPIGTSFRENACTGYLAGLQTFTPPLERSCPAPSDALPLTPENIRTYGEACYDFVQTIPSCTFPANTPPEISPACRIFLSNNLSYNGCVQNHKHESGFTRDSWRIYLNAGGELWRNTHDIVRLLDAEGRTVDMVSY